MSSIRHAAERSKQASHRLASMPEQKRNAALKAMARALKEHSLNISKENKKDLNEAQLAGLSPPLLKRLRFDEMMIEDAIRSIDSLVLLEDPIGRILSRTELDRGLILDKVTCPIGVIGVVFESRPDALVQITSLCIKTGNAVLLKGGREAKNTNEALAKAIVDAITSLDKGFEDSVQNLSTREEFRELLVLDGLVDLIIPRGSNQLVRSIQDSTKIPVLGHAAGVCHTYVDGEADIDMAVRVCYDAKVQYPAVCNAMETLLVHKDIARRFLPAMAKEFEMVRVELRGDENTRQIIEAMPATETDWCTEYNDLVLSIRIVKDMAEAIDHINNYGSHHTDAIITSNKGKAKTFMDLVDSSSVMWNCSTRFADGYRYGLGAEVGISTNKTHARGPVGLEGLTIYKWRLSGKGHIVADYIGKGARKFVHRKLR